MLELELSDHTLTNSDPWTEIIFFYCKRPQVSGGHLVLFQELIPIVQYFLSPWLDIDKLIVFYIPRLIIRKLIVRQV